MEIQELSNAMTITQISLQMRQRSRGGPQEKRHSSASVLKQRMAISAKKRVEVKSRKMNHVKLAPLHSLP
jgi:hypothetical protein